MITYLRAGLYMRLSKEDGSSESQSIKNQRDMLIEYSSKNNIEIVKMYVDDGYSGTNFNRPAFRQMINDIYIKEINVVICKDLSRLGRDYITTGRLTEEFFPKHGVRFIAVNDNVDTENYDETAPFRNLMNEMYARDISKKIKSAFYIKMKNGEYIGNFPPFGYKKSEHNKNKLVIDEMACEIVKYIFKLFFEGESATKIAEILNNEGIITPSIHKKNQFNTKYKTSNLWSPTSVSRILKNPIYTGNLYQGKTKKLSFKSNTIINVPKEKWICSKNAIPLITTRVAETKIKREVINSNLKYLKGKFTCGDCKKNMSISNNYAICSSYKSKGKTFCLPHKIEIPELEKQVKIKITDKFKLDFADKIIINDNIIKIYIKRAD